MATNLKEGNSSTVSLHQMREEDDISAAQPDRVGLSHSPIPGENLEAPNRNRAASLTWSLNTRDSARDSLGPYGYEIHGNRDSLRKSQLSTSRLIGEEDSERIELSPSPVPSIGKASDISNRSRAPSMWSQTTRDTAAARDSTITIGQYDAYGHSKKSHLSTSRLINEDDPSERAINHTDKLWTPWSLRKPTLIAFSVIFLLFIIGMEILALYSRRYNGLNAPNLPPLWAYIPVAIFFIQAAIWGQLEYRTKSLAPWYQLATGTASASRSILLDYLSPLNVSSFVASIQFKHYSVALAIFGSVILKLLIISAGALIAPRSSVAMTEASLSLFNSFGGALDISKVTPGEALLGAGSSSGMGGQPGINGTWAYQSLEPLNKTTGVQMISATVDGFFADLTCERSTNISVDNITCASDGGSSCNLQWNMTVTSATCTPGRNIAFVDSGPLGTTGMQKFGVIARALCNASDPPDATRLVMVTGYLEWTSDSTNTKKFQNATALICRPTYSVQPVMLQTAQNGSSIHPSQSGSNSSTLPNVSAADIADGVWTAVSMTGLETHSNGTIQSTALNAQSWNQSDAFIGLISLTRPDLDLSNAEDMEVGFRQVYSSTAAQIAKAQLLTPSGKVVKGSILMTEKRLHIREVPLRLMEAGLILLIITRILLIRTRPAPSTPRDLTTLAGLATVMAQSQNYVYALQGIGSATFRAIERSVNLHRYQTCVTVDGGERSFRIELEDQHDSFTPPHPTHDSRPQEWWTPVSDTTRVIVLAVTFGAIVLVELLFQHSKKHNGLTDMELTSSVHLQWLYIPALFAVLIWTLFGIVDFSTRLLQPYLVLKQRPIAARRALTVNYLSKVTVVAIRQAIINKHFPVLFTAISMLIAPFLVIVSAGLFQPVASEVRGDATINMIDSLNVNNQKPVLQSPLPVIASLAISSNTSWPRWTSDNIVLPSVGLPKGTVPSGNTTLAVAGMPGLYASLNCSRVANSELGGARTSFPNIAIPVNKGCGTPCPTAQDKDCVAIPTSNQETGSFYGRMFLTKSNPPPKGWNDNCPQVTIAYGQTVSVYGRIDNIIALNCYPAIMQANVNATFSVATWSIEAKSVDNSTAKSVASGDDATLDLNSVLVPSAFKPPAEKIDFDGAFTALVAGRDAVPLDQFLGEGNMTRVTDALDMLYGQTMAQHLNLNARSPLAAKSAPLNASITLLTLRLHQVQVSTRILEALLGAMFICVVISSLLGDNRKVLPNNPCSIAVMSSLIADSEFVKIEVAPRGTEFCDDKELRKRGVFEGYLFSLGMWDKHRGEAAMKSKVPRLFGVDVGKAEKAD